MGILRLVLALCIVFVHTQSLPLLRMAGGSQAVEAFFVISGFYMALVLNTKYVDKSAKGYRTFLFQRSMRLYPTYYLALVFSAVVYGILLLFPHNGSHPISNPLVLLHDNNLSWETKAYLLLVHVTIIGQETLLFLFSQNGHLAFTSNFLSHPAPRLFEYTFIPPAWSIAVELFFYACAPFLVRNSLKKQIVLILLSFALRGFIYYYLGWNNDPWTYRLFPTELAWFLLGSVAYQFYARYKTKLIEQHKIGRFLQVILLFVIFFYGYIHPAGARILPMLDKTALPFVDSYLLPVFVAFSIPWLFALTKDHKKDRTIGELSYPVYLLHWSLAIAVFQFEKYLPANTLGAVTAIAAVACAWLVYRYFESNVEAFRHNLFTRQQKRDTA